MYQNSITLHNLGIWKQNGNIIALHHIFYLANFMDESWQVVFALPHWSRLSFILSFLVICFSQRCLCIPWVITNLKSWSEESKEQSVVQTSCENCFHPAVVFLKYFWQIALLDCVNSLHDRRRKESLSKYSTSYFFKKFNYKLLFHSYLVLQ